MSIPNWVRAVVESDAPWEVQWMMLGQMLETIPGASPTGDPSQIAEFAGEPWVFEGYVYQFHLSDPVGKVHRKKI